MLLQKMIKQIGIEPERLRLEWISASEGEKLQKVVTDMVKKLQELGPMHSNGGKGKKGYE